MAVPHPLLQRTWTQYTPQNDHCHWGSDALHKLSMMFFWVDKNIQKHYNVNPLKKAIKAKPNDKTITPKKQSPGFEMENRHETNLKPSGWTLSKCLLQQNIVVFHVFTPISSLYPIYPNRKTTAVPPSLVSSAKWESIRKTGQPDSTTSANGTCKSSSLSRPSEFLLEGNNRSAGKKVIREGCFSLFWKEKGFCWKTFPKVLDEAIVVVWCSFNLHVFQCYFKFMCGFDAALNLQNLIVGPFRDLVSIHFGCNDWLMRCQGPMKIQSAKTMLHSIKAGHVCPMPFWQSWMLGALGTLAAACNTSVSVN